MANPSGIAPPPNMCKEASPLYPRHHLQPDDNPAFVRDLQVWPRHMRETQHSQSLYRTAAVKHHLRGMADRENMLTTYEHDFAAMTRPNPMGRSTSFGGELYGTGGKPGTATRDKLRLATSVPRLAPPKTYHDSDVDDTQSIRSDCRLGSRERDKCGTLGPSTLSKMHTMRSKDVPMRLTISGWGDTRWAPRTHPATVMSLSGSTASNMMTTNIMNLRSADLPLVSR